DAHLSSAAEDREQSGRSAASCHRRRRLQAGSQHGVRGACGVTLDDEVVRLARTRPFDLLPREAVQLIAFSCEKRRLRAGEALFFPGETADSGYFVHSGAITLLEDGAEPK